MDGKYGDCTCPECEELWGRTNVSQKWSYRGWRGALRYFLRHRKWWA